MTWRNRIDNASWSYHILISDKGTFQDSLRKTRESGPKWFAVDSRSSIFFYPDLDRNFGAAKTEQPTVALIWAGTYSFMLYILVRKQLSSSHVPRKPSSRTKLCLLAVSLSLNLVQVFSIACKGCQIRIRSMQQAYSIQNWKTHACHSQKGSNMAVCPSFRSPAMAAEFIFAI